MKIDNFMLTNWQSCPAKYDLSIRQHWQPKMKSAALGFGAVMHEGLAEWYRGSIEHLSVASRLERAIDKIRQKFPAEHPIDDYRNLNNAERLMREYVTNYPGENFEILQVEIPFTLDLGKHVPYCSSCGHLNFGEADTCAKCGEELEVIEYGGILDTVAAFGPVNYVLEHKTTSQLGPLYFRQYETSNQITGYSWALKQLSGKRVAGSIVNALCLTNASTPKIVFKRETTNRSDADFERWANFVQSECSSIKQHEATGIWPFRTEQCLTKYGLCQYHGVHTLSTDAEQQRALETFYEQREWNHELRDAAVE